MKAFVPACASLLLALSLWGCQETGPVHAAPMGPATAAPDAGPSYPWSTPVGQDQCKNDQNCLDSCLGYYCDKWKGVCQQCTPADPATCKNAQACTRDFKCTCDNDSDCRNYQSCVRGVCEKNPVCTRCRNGQCCPEGDCPL